MIMPLPIYQKTQDRPLKGVKNVIGIAAGKGGVGKSTVTVNLAHALVEKGFTVGILDADIYGPSIRHLLPEEIPPYEEEGKLFPAKSNGISTMSMAYFRDKEEPSAIRGPIASNLLKQFVHDIEWGELDYLIIDFPPGTGDIQLTLCQQNMFKGVILVTTPQEVAVMDVRKAMQLFQQFKIPILGVVENMSYYKNPISQEKIHFFGEGGGYKLASESGLTFLTSIPLDPCISQYGEKGQSLPNEASGPFQELSLQLIQS